MSLNTLKLVAIGFKRPANSILLQQCEELYAYGVLSQLARFTEIHYKDLVTLSDKISLSPEMSKTEAQQKFQQICQSTRARYLFTGAIMVSPASETELYIHFQLYDAQTDTLPVDETETLNLDAKPIEDENNPHIDILELNRLINLTTQRFLQIISDRSEPSQPLESLASLSPSLQAIRLILKAHQTASPPEKMRLYEAAIREDIELETAYCHLARLYKSENQYEKSILYYRETLKRSQAANRNKAIYSTEAGICCALLGKLDLALQWWFRAIEYDADYISPYFNIANTYEDRDEYEQAETYFLKAQALAPDDFRTFFNLARVYSKMGTWDKALNQYQHQLKTEDDDPWCHSDIATCYLNLGDIKHAKHHLQKTLALDPEGEAGQYAQLILAGFG